MSRRTALAIFLLGALSASALGAYCPAPYDDCFDGNIVANFEVPVEEIDSVPSLHHFTVGYPGMDVPPYLFTYDSVSLSISDGTVDTSIEVGVYSVNKTVNVGETCGITIEIGLDSLAYENDAIYFVISKKIVEAGCDLSEEPYTAQLSLILDFSNAAFLPKDRIEKTTDLGSLFFRPSVRLNSVISDSVNIPYLDEWFGEDITPTLSSFSCNLSAWGLDEHYEGVFFPELMLYKFSTIVVIPIFESENDTFVGNYSIPIDFVARERYLYTEYFVFDVIISSRYRESPNDFAIFALPPPVCTLALSSARENPISRISPIGPISFNVLDSQSATTLTLAVDIPQDFYPDDFSFDSYDVTPFVQCFDFERILRNDVDHRKILSYVNYYYEYYSANYQDDIEEYYTFSIESDVYESGENQNSVNFTITLESYSIYSYLYLEYYIVQVEPRSATLTLNDCYIWFARESFQLKETTEPTTEPTTGPTTEPTTGPTTEPTTGPTTGPTNGPPTATATPTGENADLSNFIDLLTAYIIIGVLAALVFVLLFYILYSRNDRSRALKRERRLSFGLAKF